jgi:phosphoserine phosphatase
MRIKMVFFDNDGTLTNNRVAWVYMHEHMGTWERGRVLLEQHITARTPYNEFAEESVKLWTGIPKTKFLERLRGIEIRPGVRTVVKKLRDAGLMLAVLSSGFSLWRDIWLEREGIVWDYYRANDLVFDENDIFTGRIIMTVTDNVPGSDKGSIVQEISMIEGVSRDERVFVGDGRGDIPGFEHCAYGIAIDPETELVRSAAKYSLEGDDFERVAQILLS